MITYFQGRHLAEHLRLADAMFRLRAEMFAKRLHWDVVVRDGCEYDELDNADPLYVLAISDDFETLNGSLRLLPTTGPTLLKTKLAKLFNNPVDIESPLIWECTRFAVRTNTARESSMGGVCPVTAELMMAVCHVAFEAGVSQVMAVFERPMLRIYRRVGWIPEIVEVSSNDIAVGLWDVNVANLETIREKNNLRMHTVTMEMVKALAAA